LHQPTHPQWRDEHRLRRPQPAHEPTAGVNRAGRDLKATQRQVKESRLARPRGRRHRQRRITAEGCVKHLALHGVEPVEAKAEAVEGVRLGARRRTYKLGAHNRASCGPPDAPAELEGVSEARRQLADAPHGVTARPARRGWARLGAWRPSQLRKLSSRRWGSTHALWLRLLAIAGRPAAQVWASDMRHIRRRLSPAREARLLCCCIGGGRPCSAERRHGVAISPPLGCLARTPPGLCEAHGCDAKRNAERGHFGRSTHGKWTDFRPNRDLTRASQAGAASRVAVGLDVHKNGALVALVRRVEH
jgi:hypothetical protein